ncbi:MAG: hypothetical protein D6681_22160 [Calditrichaeota bacterium]|nr:MAG: hypothetical protein D6681_22160 [Calditrichota bacterium]
MLPQVYKLNPVKFVLLYLRRFLPGYIMKRFRHSSGHPDFLAVVAVPGCLPGSTEVIIALRFDL